MKNSTSVPQTPTRSTSTTTSPGAATGAGTSCTSPSLSPVRTYARMVRVLIAVIISFSPERCALSLSKGRASTPRPPSARKEP